MQRCGAIANRYTSDPVGSLGSHLLPHTLGTRLPSLQERVRACPPPPPQHHTVAHLPDLQVLLQTSTWHGHWRGAPLCKRHRERNAFTGRRRGRVQGLLLGRRQELLLETGLRRHAHVPDQALTQPELGTGVCVSRKLPTSVFSLSKKQKVKSTPRAHVSASPPLQHFTTITALSAAPSGRP